MWYKEEKELLTGSRAVTQEGKPPTDLAGKGHQGSCPLAQGKGQRGGGIGGHWKGGAVSGRARILAGMSPTKAYMLSSHGWGGGEGQLHVPPASLTLLSPVPCLAISSPFPAEGHAQGGGAVGDKVG